MSAGAFALMPSAWVRRPRFTEPTDGTVPPGFVPVDLDGLGEGLLAKGGLIMLQWRQHKGAATAALLLLFALAVIANQAQRHHGLRQNNQVAATYEQLQAMVPLSRKLIADGLQLLLMVEAIGFTRDGRRNLYTLNGIEHNGSWCMLPQSHLLQRQQHLARLQVFIDQIRRRESLHALKVYMLILAFRDRHTNFAAIGYDKIGHYAGLRREEISTATAMLASLQLVRQVSDEEHPRRRGDPHHNRYFVCGLVAR
ncbi:MAG: hypothetical protein K2X55_17990 [Burkholderiaceae bacterium]|nr:hypothetical protein [Burkholderiaceae bacterium]